MEQNTYSLDKSTQVYPKDLVSDRKEVCCRNITCNMHIPLNSPHEVQRTEVKIKSSMLFSKEKNASEKSEESGNEVILNEDGGLETEEIVHMMDKILESTSYYLLRLSSFQTGKESQNDPVAIEVNENNGQTDADIDQFKITPPPKIEPCVQLVNNTKADFDKKNLITTSEKNIFSSFDGRHIETYRSFNPEFHYSNESFSKNNAAEKYQIEGLTTSRSPDIDKETLTITTQDEVEFEKSIILGGSESLNLGNSSNMKENPPITNPNEESEMKENMKRDMTLVEKEIKLVKNEIDEKSQNWKYDGIVQYRDSRTVKVTSDKIVSNIFEYDLSQSVESLSSVPPGTSFWSHRLSDYSNKFNDVIPAKRKVSVDDENDSSSFRKGSEMSDALSVDTMSFPGNFAPPPLITRNKIIASLMDKKQFVHRWLEVFRNQLKEESLFVSSLFLFLVYYICYFIFYCSIYFKCPSDY